MRSEPLRRAVSPLLATVMLMAITIAAGLVIYSLFFNAAGTASSQLSIHVISVDIIRTSSTILVSATIKNSGNKPITSCNVTVYGDSGSATLQLGPIDVGQSKSASVMDPSGFSVTVGKTYPVEIRARASDGSALHKSMVAPCTG